VKRFQNRLLIDRLQLVFLGDQAHHQKAKSPTTTQINFFLRVNKNEGGLVA